MPAAFRQAECRDSGTAWVAIRRHCQSKKQRALPRFNHAKRG